jgi:hypothetical protein
MRTTPARHRAVTPHRHHAPKPAKAPAQAKAAAQVDGFEGPKKGTVVLRAGDPAVDLNGTKYTAIEGRAADNHLSIDSKRKFDPLTERGIALTSSQARQLGVKVGDDVTVRDAKTGKTFTATFYDSAGTKPDGLKHFEVSPALADSLGITYRNKKGQVVDAVTNTENLVGRFTIER